MLLRPLTCILALTVLTFPALAQPVMVQQPDSENYVPEGTVTIQSGGSATVAAPVLRMPPKQYPDLPLATENIQEPIGVKFAFDHRSALSAKEVSVKGIVVYALTGEKACPSQDKFTGTPLHLRPIMACAQPRIILSDTTNSNRNKDFDLTVFLKSEDKTEYVVGETHVVKGVINANSNYITMHKDGVPPLPLE